MAGITLEQAEAQLAVWLAANTAVAASQSYRIVSGNIERQLTRADAAEIREQIDYWDAKVKTLSANAARRSRTRYVVPG